MGVSTGMALAAATLVRMCVRSEAVAVRVARGTPTLFDPEQSFSGGALNQISPTECTMRLTAGGRGASSLETE